MPNMNHLLTEPFPKNLTLNIGERYSFRNYEKLQEWFDLEVKFYNQIGNHNNLVNSFNGYIKRLIQDEFNRNNHIEYWEDDFIDKLKRSIEVAYKQYGLITARSNEGKWLVKLNKENPNLVAGAVTFFQNKIKGIPNPNEGAFSAFLFDKKIDPDFELEKEKYEEFYQEISTQKDDFLKELKEVKDENNRLNKLLETQNKSWEESFNNQKQEIQKKFDSEFSRHESEMKKSEDFYEKKLAVKSAVTYWTTKAKSHKTNTYIFGGISVALIALLVWAVYQFGNFILNVNLDDATGIGHRILTEKGALQLWVYGFFIITLTLVVWVIRLLVKVFLSNLHLLSDAQERETMIKTYLAFEREDNTLKSTDKELILPSIFRVSSNGIIKDDSMPNTPLNVLMKKAVS